MIDFYLDEDLSPIIAEVARDLGLDVVSCHEVGNRKLTDPQQLEYATDRHRCVVTANGRDFEIAANEWFEVGRSRAGIAVVPGSWRRSDFSRIARALLTLANDYRDQPTENLFVYLR